MTHFPSPEDVLGTAPQDSPARKQAVQARLDRIADVVKKLATSPNTYQFDVNLRTIRFRDGFETSALLGDILGALSDAGWYPLVSVDEEVLTLRVPESPW